MFFRNRKNNTENKHFEPHVIEKANTVYKKTKMSNFGLKLSYFYSHLPMWKLITITVVTAVFFGVISVFFVKNVGIYNFGLAAFGQAIARLITVKIAGKVSPGISNAIDQLVFWIAYIILSIPIFILGYKKIGKLFGHLTVIFLVVSSVVSFSIGFIDGANEVYLIGDFGNNDVKALIKDIANNNKDVTDSVKDSLLKLTPYIPLNWKEGGNIIALTIIAIGYGVILAWIFALIQIIGGTAGVTGIIGEWYSNKTQKSFGSISGYLNIAIIIISVAVGSWLPGSLFIQTIKSYVTEDVRAALSEQSKATLDLWAAKAWSFEFYLSPNFVATFITNIAYIMVLNKVYPKFKLVKIEVFSHKFSLLEEKITNDRKIVIKLTSFIAKSATTEEETHVLKTVTLFRQVPRVLKKIRQYDPEAFVAISEVSSIDGFIYLPTEKF
ncbi:DUF2179 domain-containing protein [Mycoplasmopsis columboralis]|uniref:Uncharacterized protein conserved in bacteria (DUF2179) n=1 Tax=Mycoplasmopsis columboralis TaxID=171282 RepID=A0A449B767_9BACT|nr:DUF2179 domain-containing protein [Mycoplasmopsis columboralis]VEU76431.1 Uncharacterized protein conserved in bacteria (DUF2179) [Mycoplasmopsis columboralis]